MKIKSFSVAIIFTFVPLFTIAQLHDSIVLQLKLGVEGFKNRYHSPSIVVAILHKNDIIFSEALGYVDLENQIPATLDSKYPILSISKMFTATMYMQLIQNGTVKFDDDIIKYIPEYTGENPSSNKSGTTLLQLATHTSGLPRNSPADIGFTKQVDQWMLANKKQDTIASATIEEVLRSLKYIKKEYPVYQLLRGGDRHYSNLGYSLLGISLERASRTDFEIYVMSNICQPLKMANTGVGTSTIGNTRLAKGYYFDTTKQDFIQTPIYQPNAILYAGGMYSTAKDLIKFISFQFDDSSYNQLLESKYRRMMQYFGIGWKRSYPFLLHEGSMLGFRSQIVFNPELQIGWVILTNTTDFDFNKMNDYISRLIVPQYTKKTITELSSYIGTYTLEGGYDSLKIYLKEGKLYSTYLNGTLQEVPLTLVGNNKFQAQGNDSYKKEYEFIANDRSEIAILNFGQLMWIKQ
ncbi:serine hydrolase domain-containing protein [Sinomicrobium sp. M5D2P9]